MCLEQTGVLCSFAYAFCIGAEQLRVVQGLTGRRAWRWLDTAEACCAA